MNLEFCKDRALQCEMFNYVDNVIKEFPEDVGRKSYRTPAAAHLFQVRDDAERTLLPEEQAV